MCAEETFDDDACPQRFGLIYDPPALVIEWLQPSTGRLFHRRIKFLDLAANSDSVAVAQSMRSMNEALLGERKVPFQQLVALMYKMQLSLALPPAAGSLEFSMSLTDEASNVHHEQLHHQDLVGRDDADVASPRSGHSAARLQGVDPASPRSEHAAAGLQDADPASPRSEHSAAGLQDGDSASHRSEQSSAGLQEADQASLRSEHSAAGLQDADPPSPRSEHSASGLQDAVSTNPRSEHSAAGLQDAGPASPRSEH